MNVSNETARLMASSPSPTRREGTILDLFAGPGGWDEGARQIGLETVGIEYDAAACLTRAAAGHRTIRADVASYPLDHFPPVEGLIASPPCQAFSTAGKGEGREWLVELHAHARQCVYGWKPWPHDTDPRIALVLEPLRWAIALQPEWIALEQVPPVLELWQTFAEVFRALGWECWTGILNAADYGVPQTRQRAFLLGHRRFQPQPPEPTHCKDGASTMFGDLLPWVSMASALGWGFDDRPCLTVSAGGTDTGGAEPLGRHCRTLLHTNRGQDENGDRQTRETSAPAPALSAKAGGQWAFERPATAVCADSRLSPPGYRGRPEEYEADGTYTGARSMDDAIKLTVSDALKLQSFRADYPVRGTKTKQFEQIGNAVPPLLARAVLERVA